MYHTTWYSTVHPPHRISILSPSRTPRLTVPLHLPPLPLLRPPFPPVPFLIIFTKRSEYAAVYLVLNCAIYVAVDTDIMQHKLQENATP